MPHLPGTSRSDPEVLVHAEHISALVSARIRYDEVHLVPTDEYRFLCLVQCVMPASFPELLKEVVWVLPCGQLSAPTRKT